MADNKVLFGLDNAHVAFHTQLTKKSFTVLLGCSVDGSMTVNIASIKLTTPVTVTIPLTVVAHPTPLLVAQQIVTSLTANYPINAKYKTSYDTVNQEVVIMERIAENVPDETFIVTLTPATTGVIFSSVLTTVAIGFGTPIPLKGAVNLAIDPEGEAYVFYADNGPYFSITNNNGYSGDFEIALLPDSLAIQMVGYVYDDQGMVVEMGYDAPQKSFALLCQFTGDQKNRKIVYWNCTSSRPNTEHKTTEESIEVDAHVLPLVIQPIEINHKKIVKGTVELLNTPTVDNTIAYETFFANVIIPTFCVR